jgi:copper(I)-binding protein
MRHMTLALASAVLLLAGCSQQTPSDPDAKPGLSASDARLVLPAVSGNPGAAYFSVTNASDKETSLANVAIDGAGKTELHETKAGSMAPLNWVQLAPGQTVTFAPGGKHVMAFGLDPKLKAGGTAEMTLVFSDGDKLSLPIKVEAAGAAPANGSGH